MLAVTSDLLGTTDMIYNWLCSFLETLSLARPFIYRPAEVVCSNEACVESVPVLGPHSSGAALETSGFVGQRCSALMGSQLLYRTASPSWRRACRTAASDCGGLPEEPRDVPERFLK